MLFIPSAKLFSLSRYFNFLSWIFDYLKKRLDQKDKVNFKIYHVTTWLKNNCNTDIDQSRSKDNQAMKFGQLIDEKHFF